MNRRAARLLCAICDGRGWVPDAKGRVDAWPAKCPACGGLVHLSIRQVARRTTSKGFDEDRVARAVSRLLRDRNVHPKTAHEVLKRLHSARMLPRAST